MTKDLYDKIHHRIFRKMVTNVFLPFKAEGRYQVNLRYNHQHNSLICKQTKEQRTRQRYHCTHACISTSCPFLILVFQNNSITGLPRWAASGVQQGHHRRFWVFRNARIGWIRQGFESAKKGEYHRRYPWKEEKYFLPICPRYHTPRRLSSFFTHPTNCVLFTVDKEVFCHESYGKVGAYGGVPRRSRARDDREGHSDVLWLPVHHRIAIRLPRLESSISAIYLRYISIKLRKTLSNELFYLTLHLLHQSFRRCPLLLAPRSRRSGWSQEAHQSK